MQVQLQYNTRNFYTIYAQLYVCVSDISCIKIRQRKKKEKCLSIKRLHGRGCAIVSPESELNQTSEAKDL